MAIDDEFDAIELSGRLDELATSPVTAKLEKFIELFVPFLNSLLPPVSKISDPVTSSVVGGPEIPARVAAGNDQKITSTHYCEHSIAHKSDSKRDISNSPTRISNTSGRILCRIF